MKIEQIILRNLNSIRTEVCINFNSPPLSQTGLFAIIGDTGAGKTTILDALTLALYGKIHRNKDVAEVLSYGAVECLAEVIFSTPAGQFMAKWSMRRSRNKLEGNLQTPDREISKLIKNKFQILAEKKREVEEQIESITGLDYDRFCRSVLLSQGDFAAFLKANPRHRSDLLERITGTEYYSSLSVAAFQKAKKEAEVLQGFELQKEMLSILNPEEEKVLKKEVKELEREQKLQRKKLKSFQNILQWYGSFKTLEAEQKELEKELEEWNNSSHHINDLKNKIDLYEKVEPLAGSFEKVKTKHNEQQTISRELNQIVKRKSNIETTLIELEKKLKDDTQKLKTFEEGDVAKQKLFDEIMKLDLALDLNSKQLESFQEKLVESQNQFELFQNQKQTAILEFENQKKQQKSLETWLSNNRNSSEVKTILPNVEAGWRIMARLKEQLSSDAEKLKLTRQKSDKIKKTQQVTNTALVQLQKELNILVSAIQEKWPGFNSDDPQQYFEQEQRILDQLKQQNNWLQSANEIEKLQTGFLRDYLEKEEELQNLIKEDTHLQSEILNARQQLDEAEEQVNFHQKLHEQQLQIASLDEHRTKLKGGEPCPLCGSLEHPLSNHEEALTPLVAETAKSLNKAKVFREKLNQNWKNFLNKERQLNSRIIHLAGDDERGLQGQLQLIQIRIKENEQEMSLINSQIADAGLNTKDLNEKLEGRIKKVESEKNALIKAHEEANEKRKIILDRKEQLTSATIQFKHQNEQLEAVEKQFNAARDVYKKEQEKLNHILKPYALKIEKGQRIDPLKILRERAFEYESKSKEAESVRQNGLQQDTRIKGFENQIAQHEKVSLSAKNEYETAKGTWDKLNKARHSKFGTADPETERLAWKQNKSNLENHVQRSRELKVAQETEGKQLALQLKKLKQNLSRISSQLSTLDEDLKGKLVEFKILNLEVLDQILKNQPFIKDWRESIRQNELEGNNLQSRYKATKEKLSKLKKEDRSKLPEAEIQEIIETLDQQIGEMQRRIGGVEGEIARSEKQQADQKKLLKEIQGQKKEFARWEKLNQIIGSADGKKFRVFAQSLTLEKLVQLANQHLIHLNGRYLIQKREDSDLDLEIIDTYQANNRRSVGTLSGGESFLVSLALALGLSDLAGRKIQIQSLFIDEGFGTLDDSSLDLALTTLENLQASGKTIGVISHVKALKERISVRVQVLKNANGISRIEIQA